MTTNGEGVRTIGAVERAAAILDAVQRRNGATLSELAEDVPLTKGALHTHLTTLQREGLLERTDGTWRLSNRFIAFGEHVRNNNPLYRAGREEVDRLAATSQETVHLITEDGGMETIVYEAFGESAVGEQFYLENRENPERHLHYSAAGKAVLASLPTDRVAEILEEHGLPGRTENTVTDRDDLLAALETVRERGYAVNDEEAVVGLRAVGAPILGPDGSVLGAISCAAPTSRLDGEAFESEVPALVREYANIIQVNLQAGDVLG